MLEILTVVHAVCILSVEPQQLMSLELYQQPGQSQSLLHQTDLSGKQVIFNVINTEKHLQKCSNAITDTWMFQWCNFKHLNQHLDIGYSHNLYY